MAPASQWERASLSVSPCLVVSKRAPLRIFVELQHELLFVFVLLSLTRSPFSISLSLSFLFPVFIIISLLP